MFVIKSEKEGYFAARLTKRLGKCRFSNTVSNAKVYKSEFVANDIIKRYQEMDNGMPDDAVVVTLKGEM